VIAVLMFVDLKVRSRGCLGCELNSLEFEALLVAMALLMVVVCPFCDRY
jgi:hypothetical protein